MSKTRKRSTIELSLMHYPLEDFGTAVVAVPGKTCVLRVPHYDGIFLDTDISDYECRLVSPLIVDKIKLHLEELKKTGKKFDELDVVFLLPADYSRQTDSESDIEANLQNRFNLESRRAWRHIWSQAVQALVYIVLSISICMYSGWLGNVDPDSFYTNIHVNGASLLGWYMNWYGLDCIFYFSPDYVRELLFHKKMLRSSFRFVTCSGPKQRKSSF